MDESAQFNVKDLKYRVEVNNDTKAILETCVRDIFNGFMALAEPLLLFATSAVTFLESAFSVCNHNNPMFREALRAVLRQSAHRLRREVRDSMK
jgi:hypothetical protein